MKVLLQKNIWQEYAYERFIHSLQSENVEFQEVNLIPFTKEFDVPVNGVPDYVFGSTRFVHVCRQMGFKVFNGFPAYVDRYPGQEWVNNGDFVIMEWGNCPVQIKNFPKFIKPMHSEKFFTGRIFESIGDLNNAQLSTSFISDENKVEVLVCDPVGIVKEIRFFVVDGKVSTASVYKVNGIPKYDGVKEYHPAWGKVEELIKSYGVPEEAFVVDMGLCGNKWKIVEFNCIQSSGLYSCDTDYLVQDLKNFYNKTHQ